MSDIVEEGTGRLEDGQAFDAFLARALAATDREDLANVDRAAYEARLRSTFARLGARNERPHDIAYDGDSDSGLAIIDIYSANKPFIVDSVLAALRARGATVRLVANPVVPLGERIGKDGPHPRRESVVHVEIDPPPDEAATRALLAELDATLQDVALAVRDWRPILDRLRHLAGELEERAPASVPREALKEALAFLAWLAANNFTFLGLRDYKAEGEGDGARLVPDRTSGLGILARPDLRFMRSGTEFVEMTPQHAAFLAEPDPVMVTKANLRARVHRRAHMDYIGIKRYGPGGAVIGETRVLGLFTSMALATPHEQVPLVRRKLAEVVARSGLDPAGHDGKALLAALDSYPRDELFQISTDQLAEFAGLIAGLAERPRLRVLARPDRFDNFASILVYVPRDRYSSKVRADIGDRLAERYDGRVSAYYPSFSEGETVRVHYIIGRVGGPTPQPERAALEAELGDLTRGFAERLLAEAPQPAAVAAYAGAFPAAYQARRTPSDALADIEILGDLAGSGRIAVRLRRGTGVDEDVGLNLEVYHAGAPIPLSDRVPMLENFGFRVVDERTYAIHPEGMAPFYIHDMIVEPPAGVTLTESDRDRFEQAVLAVWEGLAENDNYNALTAVARLGWVEVAILRALGHYQRQLGLSYSQRYLAGTLTRHPAAAGALVALFRALHDPAWTGDRQAAAGREHQAIEAALEATPSLDEDTIIRRLLNSVEASLRTNVFQRDADGRRRPALAIKFDCATVDGMPEPRPFREIFVSSPRVEGLHLRFGPIARGGIRWSDRPEDFRTEVLALVKAQQVKNAIIVPVGAKGAFVPRRMPAAPDRATFMAEGTACYEIFISSLIELTDNIEGAGIVPPAATVRRDGDDPYLVVAADKGTAHLSDTANAIAIAHGYWLGDAFASGGSVGYDHKEMGITARGAFETVKRHFREMDRDIMASPFTAVGVGDMSGDVFGNGMLVSPMTRLIAAFDHRDIFIDPDPDPAVSLAERRRLFGLERSSWLDYDKSLLSRGGGVYPRALKSVPLSPEARAVLGLNEEEEPTPAEVIRAILRAEVDLLWFGGIGTYVRATGETDAAVGDRNNDNLRITAAELRAKVVGEGANLAVTQRARVEYALAGGRINTDAIDNSAGVNSSDLEVNIKIALGPVVSAGKLGPEARKAYLASLTDEVAALCLRNNYLQSLALSLAERAGLDELPDHRALIETLEDSSALSRAVEFLPTDAALDQRATSCRGLTRPELAVLLAYAKNDARADLLASSVPDDPWLGRELFRYFPDALGADHPELIEGHRLRREVIATVIANAMINRGGPAYVATMMRATSAGVGEVAAAYALVRDSFGLTALNAAIDALDGKVQGDTQLALYAGVRRTLGRETLWFLRNGDRAAELSAEIERYRAGVETVRAGLDALLPAAFSQSIGEHAEAFEAGGAPAELARRVAELPALALATDIVLVGTRAGAGTETAAEAFFRVLALFGLSRILDGTEAMELSDPFDRMALDRALANLMRAQRDLSLDVLKAGDGPVTRRAERWHAASRTAIDRTVGAVAALTEGDMTVSRLSVAAGLLSDLARSA